MERVTAPDCKEMNALAARYGLCKYPGMGSVRKFAEQTAITAPGVESFRKYVLFIQNGIRLLDEKGNLIQTALEDNEEPKDTGEKGYNYRSERFANRLVRDPRIWKVL